MKKLILKCDFLSDKPELFINTNSRFRTLSGGILSILTCMLILAAALNFTVELLSKKSSVIIFNQIPNVKPFLNMTDIPFMIMLQDMNFKPVKDEERLYEIRAHIWKATPDSSLGVPIITTNSMEIKLERCNLNKHFGIYREDFKNVPFLEHHYCNIPGANLLELDGIFGSLNNYTFLDLTINKCDNSTRADKIKKCMNYEIIDKALEESYVSFKFLDYSVDHQDTENPAKYYLRSDSLPVSSTIYKRNWYSLKNVNYTLDNGLLLSSPQTNEFYQVGTPKETVDLRKSNTITQVTIAMDRTIDTYKRSFQKVQQTIANVGGITKGLIIITSCINFILSKELYFIELICAIFTEFYAVENYHQPAKKRISRFFSSDIKGAMKKTSIFFRNEISSKMLLDLPQNSLYNIFNFE